MTPQQAGIPDVSVRRVLHPDIRFNALEPGPTATDMTAAFGIGRPAAESARVVVRLATLDRTGPTGTLQDEAGTLPW